VNVDALCASSDNALNGDIFFHLMSASGHKQKSAKASSKSAVHLLADCKIAPNNDPLWKMI